MTAKTKPIEKKLRPAHELIPDEQARRAYPVDLREEAQARIHEIAATIWHHENASEEQIKIVIVRAIEHFNSLTPRDGAEGMLAKQMVATHFAAIECMRRAAIPNQYSEARNQELNRAMKLMSLYARQLATLDKHRGKGQQKVTVEHVYVAEGGQAILGHIDAGSGRRDKADETQVTYHPSLEVPLETEARMPKTARGKR